MYRSNNLLKLAQGEKCLLQTSARCLGDEGSTTVAAHSNELRHGKGRGLKAEDCYSVWACYHCHHWLDQGSANWQAKEDAFRQAFLRQLREWADIAQSPTRKPWKIQAARDVLAYLGDQNG